MTTGNVLDAETRQSVLNWAVQKKVVLSISLLPEAQYHNLRSQLVRFDAGQEVIQITYPVPTDHRVPPELPAGQLLGASFRRGHKKCIFVAPVLMRRAEQTHDGLNCDTLILRMPRTIREMQRRMYQRVTVLPHTFLAAKLWEGGLPQPGQTPWPICAGRVGNVSAGGVLVEIRMDQNPKLGVGDLVGVEITVRPGLPPLCVQAQYRHCVLSGPDRIGLGLQFVGLEQDVPGRATLLDLADLVRDLRRAGARFSDHDDDH